MGRLARRPAVVAAALVAMLAGVPAGVAHAAPGTISGHARDAVGLPLGDVCVTLFTSASDRRAVKDMRTGSDGAYSFDTDPGSYLVKFADCGNRDLVTTWHPAGRDWPSGTVIVLADGQRRDGIDAQLPQGGSVTGTATRSNGEPAYGVQVMVRRNSVWGDSYPIGEYVTLGEGGRFVARGVPAGTYKVLFHTGGEYASRFYGDTADAGATPDVVVTAGEERSGVDVVIPKAGTISGVARDDTGAPYEGLCVYALSSLAPGSLPWWGARTAADGSYTLKELGDATYRVQFHDCTRVTAATWYPDATTFESATGITVTDGASITGIDVVVSRGITLTGTVRATDGTPLAGVGVMVHDAATGHSTGHNPATDSNGRYVVHGLRGTRYVVRAYADQYVERWHPNAATREGATVVDLSDGRDRDGVDVSLPRGGMISGTVTDTAGGYADKVCVYALERTTGQGSTARVDTSGHYLVRGLDTGSYLVSFRTCGAANWAPHYYGGTDDPETATPVGVTLEQETTGIDGTVSPGGSITGVVRGLDGQPLRRMCASVQRPVPGLLPGHVSATDDNGRYNVTALAPHDDYRVHFTDCYTQPARYIPTWNGAAPERSLAPPVVVTAGGTGVADTVMVRGGSISGRVFDQFGMPLYGVCVFVTTSDYSSTGYGSTRQEGTYAIGGLRAGTYRVTFSDCGAGIVASVTYPGDVRVEPEQDVTGIDAVVQVVTTPTAPRSVTVAPGDRSADVGWQPPVDDGNATVTAYEVRTSSGVLVARTGGTARSVTVAGLTNGTTYSLTVNAVNVKGAGEESDPVSVRPRPTARLSVTAPATLVSGTAATVTARLTNPSGTAVPGARVELFARRRGSTAPLARVAALTTSSTGYARFAIRPSYPTEYSVRFAGTPDLGPVRVTRVVSVAPRLAVAVSGRTVSVSVSPAAGGGRARLQVLRSTGWVNVVGADISSTGRATLRAPAAGTYRVIVLRTGWATAVGGRLRIT